VTATANKPATIATDRSDDGLPRDDISLSRRITLPKLATIAAVIAIIYFARDVLLPLSTAMLITFALSPLATRLRKAGLPHLPSVLVVVAFAFTVVGLFALVVTSQLGSLAQNLPSFQANILIKVEALRDANTDNGLVSRLVSMFAAINDEIGSAVPAVTDAVRGAAAPRLADAPMPVEVIENKSPITVLQDLVLPLISPIATVGLVIVVVVFMLLERDDLRDRFIRLVGSNDLHRTTQVLQEAGKRVAQYLLVQLLVNLIYALPIGLGLWLIGVPNAPLWGLLTLVLRFIPYIGTVLAAVFPMFLAFAVSPDWTALLWTVALFGGVELITSNVIEPYLYGSRTGVSPLAIIVSAIVWTWLWGPFGLVLSTPLTVCLVVLGRHIPQFEVFDILFGDDPVLAPHARLYQRLLVGEASESTFRAQEALEVQFLSDYYGDIGLPALMIAQNDHARGVLTQEQRNHVAEVAQAMIADLAPVVLEELAEAQAEAKGGARLPGFGYSVLCLGGRSDLDDAAAAMVAQTLAAEGATSAHRPHTDLAPQHFAMLDVANTQTVVLVFLDPQPSRASFLHIRRIKKAAPHLRVGVMICETPGDDIGGLVRTTATQPVSEANLTEALTIGADFAVRSLQDVVKGVCVADPPKVLPPTERPIRRRMRTMRPVAAVA